MSDPSGALDSRAIVELSKSCLDAPGEMHVLRAHTFADDEDAHDDALQDRLNAEFREQLDRYINFLEAEFGPATIVDLDSEAVDEADADEALSLLEGAIKLAWWTQDDATLYVATAQEDREAPLTLVIGAQ
jgi:hypothetical protein